MAITIDNLTTVSLRRGEIFRRTIQEGTILDRFIMHTGYNKGPNIYRYYTGGGDLGQCCTNPEGGGTFDEKEFRTACIRKENRFCGPDLMEKLNDFEFRVTAGNESIDRRLEDLFTEEELAFLQHQINQLTWKGDTTLDCDVQPNLCLIDGLLKQATDNGNVVTPAATSTNIYSAIVQLVRSLPLDARRLGPIGVFIPPEYSDILQLGLVGLNLYHYPPGERGLYDTYTLPGIASVTIIPAQGLEGTNQMLATPLRNIHWFTNLADDMMTLAWEKCSCSTDWMWYIQFIFGVTFVFDDYVSIMTLTDDIVAGRIGIPVDIVSPLGTTGGVKTESTGGVAPTSLSIGDAAAALEAAGITLTAAQKKKLTLENETPAEGENETPLAA